MKKIVKLSVLAGIFGLAVYSLFITVAKADTNSANLIEDPGFETSLSNFETNQTGTSVSATTTNPISGSRSLVIDIAGYGDSVLWNGKDFSTAANKRFTQFTGSAHIRSTIASASNIQFCGLINYANGNDVQQCTSVSGSVGDKGVVNLNFSLDNTRDLNFLEVGFFQEGSQALKNVLVDDVSVVLNSASTTNTTFTLSVSKTGNGTITSVPNGISCGATCSSSFNNGTSVTLTTTPAAGNTFAGWSGACSGTGTCTISMTAAKSVAATFNTTATPVNGVCGSANGGTFTSVPTTNLCSAGTASSVNGSGPWSWTCAGSNSGTTASCGASLTQTTTTTIQTPNVPSGYQLVDLLAPDNGFEQGKNGFAPFSSADGSVTQTTTNAITPAKSLKVIANGYGRISKDLQYPWDNGPLALSVTVAGKLRVDASSVNGQKMEVCTIAYLQVSGAMVSKCASFAVSPTTVNNVYLELPISGQKLRSVTFQLDSNSGSKMTATLDDAHLYVVQPIPTTPSPTNGTCGSANGGTFTSVPTTNLCSAGTASSVNGSGPWTWTCAGSNSGTTTSCGASLTQTTTTTPPSCTADTWTCTAYSPCSANGTQTRSCIMTVDCPGIVTPSPSTTQSCTPTTTTTPGAGLKPTTPNNLYAAGILPNAIYLKWSQSDSPTVPGQTKSTITNYRISRDGNQIANVDNRTLQFEDTDLTANSSHNYSITAVDSANRLSTAATASASTIPVMPVGSASVHPVLFPAGYIAHLALGGSDWTAMKQSCDTDLNSTIQNSYAGWEWHDAAVLYSTCYTVSKQRGETVNANNYAKKTLAMAMMLAHNSNLGTDDPSDQPIGLGNNTQRTFTLPFTPMFPSQLRVSLIGTRVKSVVRTTGHDSLGAFAPIMKISNTSGGASNYPSPAYTLDFRDKDGLDADHNGEMDTFNIRWFGATQPSVGATYFVTVADGAVTVLPSNAFTISGTTLTLNSAPTANQAVFVSYIGSNYEQTGNDLGGLNSIEPDGPGYQMRTFNPGLAVAYDALHDSGLLTTAMKTEFYTILNSQVDWCTNFCFENDGSSGETGNYFVRGLTGGTFLTAYATDGENPRATEMKNRANLFVSQIYKGVAKDISDGEWLEGQYANGMINDILQLMSLYQDITGLNLLSSLQWTNNIVPAIIHGTKPGFQSFYDSGDWSPVPATPIVAGLQAFRQYVPSNANGNFAGKLLQEVGENPLGPITDYRNSFPLSFLGKVQSPIFSRSDWSTNAVWMSLAANDIVAPHQHLDAGHIEINRAGANLLQDAGGYGDMDTLPWHNTIGIDDRGFGNNSVYPPGQSGNWDPNSQIIKRTETGLFTYGKADIGPAYTNNDGVSNSVTQALRSVVFLRPDKIVVFDQVQVANAGVKKIFNLNFGGPLVNQNGIWSTTVNSSKLFMQPLLAPSTAPATRQLPGQDNIVSTNYQEIVSGNTKDLFLHVFQAVPSSIAAMTPGKLMKSVDRNMQGTEVSANGTLWAVLFAAFDRTFGGNVQYALPSAGDHKHLVNDLLPTNAYVVSVTNAQDTILRTISTTTDNNGSLTFDSVSGETYFFITPGTTVPTSVPPVTTDPNV